MWHKGTVSGTFARVILEVVSFYILSYLYLRACKNPYIWSTSKLRRIKLNFQEMDIDFAEEYYALLQSE